MGVTQGLVGETRRWMDGYMAGWLADGCMDRQTGILIRGQYLDKRTEAFAEDVCRRAGLSA